jgi:hypothetical protein
MPAAASTSPSVRVVGNHLVSSSGQSLRLLGVDRSGTEYQCITGPGFFNGPTNSASVKAIASWHANAVRVPLNEDCWLGINGAPLTGTAKTYRAAIVNYVKTLNAGGLLAILDLHWSDPGSIPAKAGQVMPDADHSPAFWGSVARTFKTNHRVIFDLYSEPHSVPWPCWLNGCQVSTLCNQLGQCLSSQPWTTAGMQSLVNAVRATGATQPLMIGGLSYASDLSQWLSFQPKDPAKQLIASVHVYPGPTQNPAFWGSFIAPVAARVPVVSGEIGESDCGETFIDSYMSWADQHGVSYLGWEWDIVAGGITCENGPSLILTYDGYPTPYGAGIQAHLGALANAAAHNKTKH